MIIDCHGHYTTAPRAHTDWRQAQKAAFEAGQYLHVPLLQGTNHDEGRFFVGIEFDVLGHHPLTAAQYPQVVAAQFGAKAAKAILAQYPLKAFASPDLAFAKVLTDSEFSCPALLADILTQRSGTYAYEFSDPSPPNPSSTRATWHWR